MPAAAKNRIDLTFRAFADPIRLRILNLIQDGELCVCDLVDVLKGVRNTNLIVINNGVASPLSGFRYANVIVENAIRTPWEAVPVVVGMEYQHNLRAATDRSTATSLRFDVGRAQRSGDWNVGYHIFRVEQEAILAGLGESDWRAPSNVLQQRIAIDRMLHSNVQLSFTLYRGRTLDRTLPGALTAPNLPPGVRDPWTNRAYWDITYRY